MGLFTQKTGGWHRFLAPYYVSSAVLVASYWLTKAWFLKHGDPKYSHVYSTIALVEKEKFALTLLSLALVMKYWRRQSVDSFLSDALTYSKSAVVLLVWYMDWRISIYYLLLYMVTYLLFPQPIYRGISALEHFTPASFHTMVVESPQPADMSWLVEFYAPWAPPCIHLEPVFAGLSLKYTTERLRFGKVDASRWPQVAKQHRVAVYGALPQLPTFILFEHGKEVGRIPHVFEDGSVATIKIRREDLIVAFGLEDFLEEAEKKNTTAAPAASNKKPASAATSGGGSTKKRR